MAKAVGDCRPSIGGAGSKLTLMVRIPGSGKLTECRLSSLRTRHSPDCTTDGSRGSFCRAGAFGKSPLERGGRSRDHAAFGDESGYQPRRRDVEGVIGRRRTIGRDSYGFDAAIARAASDGRHLVGVALFDWN